jgi:PAS domain S-box-containing protein
VVLVLSVAFSVLLWLLVRKEEQTRIQAVQRVQAEALVEQLGAQMKGMEETLRSTAGFLGRGPLPTRSEWHTYVEELRLPATYPGLQGLGFAEWISKQDLPAHLRRFRREGFPDYRIIRGGTLPQDPEGYSSIIYLEPMDERNQRAFGKDMLAEAVRREAMLRTRDTGLTTLSGPVTLYQETGIATQVGTLLYAPVYRFGQPLETVAQRREAFLGWAYYPFRMADLVRATLARDLAMADLELFDGEAPSSSSALFASAPGLSASSSEVGLSRSLEVAGRIWTVRIHPNATFFVSAGRHSHWEFLAGGLFVSCLLFTVLVMAQTGEERAKRLADLRGEELLATELRFRTLFEKAPLGMAIVDIASGRFLSANPRLGEILGYSPEELQERTFQSVTHPDHVVADMASVQALAQNEAGEYQKEKRYLHRDGHVIWARLSAARLPSPLAGAGRVLALVEDISEAREIAEELRLSEERFRRLFDLSPDPITVSRPGDGTLVMVNPAWCELTGIPQEEAMGRSPVELGVWVRPAERGALVAETVRKGYHQTLEVAFLRRDGSEGQLLVTAKLMRIGNEELILGMGKDVSERHQIEMALLESEARYRVLFDLSPHGISLTRIRDGIILEVNQAWEMLSGFTREEVVGRTSLELGLHVDVDKRARLFQEALPAGRIPACQMTLRRKGHGAFEAQVLASVLEIGGDKILVVALEDISERLASQRALAESEGRFRILAEENPVALFLHREGRIAYLNPAALRLLGASDAAQLTGQPIIDRVHPDDRPRVRERVHQAYELGADLPRIQERFLAMDGSAVEVEAGGRSVLFEGQPAVLLFAQDIRDRKRAEESEFRARKAESLVLMAGGIAHDFNNLFQALQGNLDLAELNNHGDPSIQRPLDRAKAALEKAVSLSWKMLDFSGRGFLRMIPLDLASWLEESRAMVLADLPAGFRFELECEPVPLIQGDASKLFQALQAVVDNAREASAGTAGGIRIRLFADLRVNRFRLGASGIWPLRRPDLPVTVCLEICDEGPGIPEERLNLICDPFYTTKEAGRGLGLPVTVGILNAHRAGLHILCAEGKGLVLRIHFPPATT